MPSRDESHSFIHSFVRSTARRLFIHACTGVIAMVTRDRDQDRIGSVRDQDAGHAAGKK